MIWMIGHVLQPVEVEGHQRGTNFGTGMQDPIELSRRLFEAQRFLREGKQRMEHRIEIKQVQSLLVVRVD